MEMKEPALARELLIEAGKKLGSFNSQEVANPLWAMHGKNGLSRSALEISNMLY